MLIIKNKVFQIVLGLITIGLFIFGLTVITSGQDINLEKVEETTQNELSQPLLTDYKAVKIGMTADEVKEKLGKPKVEDKDGFFYVISKEEQAQIGLDSDKKVRVIVIMYDDKNGNAPTFKNVFGTEPENAKQTNGSIYNLVRYTNERIWVAYSRIAGDNPSVTVTIQKMPSVN